jgi:hypothetical protein
VFSELLITHDAPPVVTHGIDVPFTVTLSVIVPACRHTAEANRMKRVATNGLRFTDLHLLTLKIFALSGVRCNA